MGEITINEDTILWKFFDNKKLIKEKSLNRKDIKEVKTEINYLTGNVYSNFTITFLLKELNIDLNNKEQKFTKKDGKSYYIGILSTNKKEFLALRLQIESLYNDYKKVVKNGNNEFLVESENIKDSFIYLRSNAIGYFVEFYNVSRKEELKTLKEMGK